MAKRNDTNEAKPQPQAKDAVSNPASAARDDKQVSFSDWASI